MWVGLIWLQIGISDGLLIRVYLNFEFHKGRERAAHLNLLVLGEELLIIKFSPASCSFFPLRYSILFSNTINQCSSLNVGDKVSH
jgi:hypothetical protein